MDTQTRHALKQDKLVQVAQSSVDWLQENRSRVIGVTAALVLVFALAIAGLVVYSHRSAAAEVAFGQAIDTYSAPLTQPGQPATPGQTVFANASERARAANRQFVAIADHYGMLKAGRNARYFAGVTAIDFGQTGAAEADLNQVANSHDAQLAALAKLALANLYQQTSRTSEAAVLYRQLIAKPTSTVPKDAAQLQLAALFETTNPSEARRIYAQMKDDKTAAGQIASQKLAPK